MAFEIKDRWTDRVLYSSDKAADIREAIIEAVQSGANLETIRMDFEDVLMHAVAEIPALRAKIVAGEIDGSVYSGECACLVGTIANIKHCNYGKIEGIAPDASRPIERFFGAISPGDTPEESQHAAIAVKWIDEFLAKLDHAVKIRAAMPGFTLEFDGDLNVSVKSDENQQ